MAIVIVPRYRCRISPRYDDESDNDIDVVATVGIDDQQLLLPLVFRTDIKLLLISAIKSHAKTMAMKYKRQYRILNDFQSTNITVEL